MKRLTALLTLSIAFGVAACDDPRSNEPEYGEAPAEAPVAPAAEDFAAPVAEPSADAPRTDTTTLPPEKRSSEESVQPESETLFY
jgi:hypothetical protein